ncbi:hypothetical protein WJX79_007813 [Trebouxia sp. C0005]
MSKRRQSCSSEDLQAGFQCSKKAKSQASAVGQEPAEPNSDESHRTEQLLHRDSVTPPQRRPVRKRRANQTKSATRGSSKAAPPPLLFCPTQTTSEESSDILHYNPDTALYYPGTDLVIDGWFQPCRGCGAFTAGRLTAASKVAPVCQRCQEKLSKAVQGVPPYEHATAREGCIDYFYGWMKIKVPLKRQQTAADRLVVQHDLIVRMSEHWVSCREEARAQNCRIPCA